MNCVRECITDPSAKEKEAPAGNVKPPDLRQRSKHLYGQRRGDVVIRYLQTMEVAS